MPILRPIVQVVLGLAALAVSAFFALSVAVITIMAITGLVTWQALATRLRPIPVRASTPGGKSASNRGEPMRVWNDGRGTIIDL